MKLGEKIVIVGSCGSGKTTLSNRLSEISGIEVIHLDRIYWQADWISISEDAFRNEQIKLLRKARWIVDGNYASSFELRLTKADTVIFLDYNRYICIWRVLKRWMKFRGRLRPDVADGCYEKMEWDFLKYIWRFPKDTRPLMLDTLDKYENLNKIILKNTQETNRMIETLENRLG